MVPSATDLLTFQTHDIYKMDPPRVKELIEQKKPAREANKNKLERWQDETVWAAASQLLTQQWDNRYLPCTTRPGHPACSCTAPSRTGSQTWSGTLSVNSAHTAPTPFLPWSTPHVKKCILQNSVNVRNAAHLSVHLEMTKMAHFVTYVRPQFF